MSGTMSPMAGKQTRKRSSFQQFTGAEPEDSSNTLSTSLERPSLAVRFRSTNSIIGLTKGHREPMADSDWEDMPDEDDDDKHSQLTMSSPTRRPTHPAIDNHSEIPLFRRFRFVALVGAFVILFTQHIFALSGTSRPILGANAVAFDKQQLNNQLIKRADSPTNICRRWAHQSALVNGTLYLYGGRATTSSTQTSHTWNNNFLTIDLTKGWSRSSPVLSGLPQPSGPPNVSLGYLWNSYDSLFLYGGEFEENPAATPAPNSLWEYVIASSTWKERKNPKTSGGVNAEAAGQNIERVAEGAGFSMASHGKGWYFGGHLDFLTTQDWSIQTPRLYLKSFVEYTFPGYKTVEGKTAGSDGEWRNITSGGIQDQAGFTERADGLLLYIPGYGDQGVLVSLAGGTNETFTQMDQVDVFDIATSKWYRQATSGSTPKIRVNPCAVTAAAVDGSSYNIYMFGGQNLIPYGEQIQYNDMWILSVPSFTWIEVNTKDQSVPYPRVGHTCNIWDGQMIVVGGYIPPDITCDSPGTYVFNLSSLSWSNQYTPLSDSKTNPFSQHPNQRGANITAGLPGSYGFSVPEAVYKVIGGTRTGGATLTAPVQTATAGPLASGHPVVYPDLTDEKRNKGARIGAIVAGTIAGVLLLVALYLGFCAYVYRKQLKIYRQHIALAQRTSSNTSTYGEKPYGLEPPTGLAAALTASPGRHSQGSYIGGSGSGSGSNHDDNVITAYNPHHSLGGGGNQPYAALLNAAHRSDDASLDDDDDAWYGKLEPSFVGVMMHPRRSLRVINRD